MNVASQFIVIDDDPTSNLICKMVIQKYLNPLGIETFTSPQMGLDYIQSDFNTRIRDQSTVLFLDLHMPIISGWEFLVELEKMGTIQTDLFKVYILSSTPEVMDTIKSKKNKLITDYLVKPLTKEKVLAIFGA